MNPGLHHLQKYMVLILDGNSCCARKKKNIKRYSICDRPRSNQMPGTDQITEIPCAPINELTSNISTMMIHK